MPFPLTNLKNPYAWARFLGTCAAGLAVDLLTKYWAFSTLAKQIVIDAEGHVRVYSDEYRFIPNWLHFETTANQGAVFGIGHGQVSLFIVVSVFAIALLTYMFATAGRGRFSHIVLGMLLAGVLGNMYDRVTYGYVRDMLHMLPGWPNPLRGVFPSWQYLFPWIFNIADVLLCTGVGLTLLLGLFHREEAPQPAAAEQAEARPRA